MRKPILSAVFIVVMVAIVVGVDVMVFSHRFWERLIVNTAVVLVFVLFYFVFLKD